MNRLTQKDDCGNWCLKGLPWNKIYPGTPTLTQKDYELLYGALYKLLDYEETGLDPEEVERVNDFTRNQAALHLGKYQDERQEREYWQQEARRQAAAAGELKIALAEKLNELAKRIADREETQRGIEDNLQWVVVEWQTKQLKVIKDWLEGLINGEEVTR